jgi:hypothetical protein
MFIYRNRGFRKELPPPAIWKQGLAALLGLFFVIIGACFEYWHSPVAAFVAMGLGYFVANFLFALSKTLSISDKMTLLVAMHCAPFCLLLTMSVNGLVPLIFCTFTCSLAGIALASKWTKAGKGQVRSRAMG